MVWGLRRGFPKEVTLELRLERYKIEECSNTNKTLSRQVLSALGCTLSGVLFRNPVECGGLLSCENQLRRLWHRPGTHPLPLISFFLAPTILQGPALLHQDHQCWGASPLLCTDHHQRACSVAAAGAPRRSPLHLCFHAGCQGRRDTPSTENHHTVCWAFIMSLGAAVLAG